MAFIVAAANNLLTSDGLANGIATLSGKGLLYPVSAKVQVVDPTTGVGLNCVVTANATNTITVRLLETIQNDPPSAKHPDLTLFTVADGSLVTMNAQPINDQFNLSQHASVGNFDTIQTFSGGAQVLTIGSTGTGIVNVGNGAGEAVTGDLTTTGVLKGDALQTKTGGAHSLLVGTTGTGVVDVGNATGGVVTGGQLTIGGTLLKSFTTTITAHPGNTPVAATLLSTDINVITVIATTLDSVILPASTPGLVITVVDNVLDAAKSLSIYPPTGSAIDALGANNPFTLAGSATVPVMKRFLCVTSSLWMSF